MKDGIYGKICLEKTSHIIRHFSDNCFLIWNWATNNLINIT